MISFDYTKKNGYDVLASRGINDVVFSLNDRLEYFHPYIEKQINNVPLLSVSNIFSSFGTVGFIGMLLHKKKSKNGHLLLDVEDSTGFVRVLVNKNNPCFLQAQEIPLDSIIGVVGKVGEEIIFSNEIILPKPLVARKQKAPIGKYILFINGFTLFEQKIKELFSTLKKNTIAVVFMNFLGDKDVAQKILDMADGVFVFFVPGFSSFCTKEFPQSFLFDTKGCLLNPAHIKINESYFSFFIDNASGWTTYKRYLLSLVEGGNLFPDYTQSKTQPHLAGNVFLPPKTDLLFILGKEDISFSQKGVMIISKKKDTLTYVDIGSLEVVF